MHTLIMTDNNPAFSRLIWDWRR